MEVISDFINKVSHEGAQHTGDVSKVIQAKLKIILSEMIGGCEEITGAMVSSVDGLAWAELLPDSLDPNRFAAMSSALLALGDTMMKETQNARPKNVFLEGNSGMILILHAGKNLLLTIFTVETQHIGMPLAFAKKASEEISQLNLNVLSEHSG
jgi:predicted regulator of Ras-like GTPase activity (Roadblock/LC7/MglB family)